MRPIAMQWILIVAACCWWLGLPEVSLGQPATGADGDSSASAVVEQCKDNLIGVPEPTPEMLASDELWGTAAGFDQQISGVDSCTQCHAQSQSDPRKSVFKHHDRWIMRDEALIWEHEDKHFQAFAVLLTENSRRIGERLYANTPRPDAKVYEDVRCLACHTAVPVPQMESATAYSSGFLTGTRDCKVYNIGVSCEGCHGPAGTPGKAWEREHYSNEHWRTMPAVSKFRKFGYWDVRSPVSKTKICLSCHLGNVAQRKIITHEMYAAGHPPLPAFELASFIAQEPEHWRRLGEKDPAIRDRFLKDTNTPFDPADLHETRELLIAALVTMSESLRLNLDLANAPAQADGQIAQWPELANYSCYACHHELVSPSWRQARLEAKPNALNRSIVPGRPLPHEWPFSLAGVAAKVALGNDKDFSAQVETVLKAYSKQPFGNNATLNEEIGSIADWSEKLALQLANGNIKIDGTDVLLLICERAAKEDYDYDSSRQLAWAFERIYSEMQRQKKGGVQALPPPERVEKYKSTDKDCVKPDWPADPDEEIKPELSKLSEMLVLDLRAGDCTSLESKLGGDDFIRRIFEVSLSDSLKPIETYDPKNVGKVFNDLRAKIKDAD